MTTRNGAKPDEGRPTEGRADGAPVEVEDDRPVGLAHDIGDDFRERGMARRLASTIRLREGCTSGTRIQAT